MLNPPRPDADVLDEDFVNYGFGNELPLIRRIEVSAEQDGGRRQPLRDLVFGLRAAGTFLGVAGESPTNPEEYFVVRLGSDGTFGASDTSDYLFGEIDGVARGSWQRTGARSLEIRSLVLMAGLGDVARDRWVIELSEDGQQASGTITREIFLRSQIFDPLDPNTDAVPVETRQFVMTMRRLVVPDAAP
jgi:hypothetical protein